jgi:hypothetical protein
LLYFGFVPLALHAPHQICCVLDLIVGITANKCSAHNTILSGPWAKSSKVFNIASEDSTVALSIGPITTVGGLSPMPDWLLIATKFRASSTFSPPSPTGSPIGVPISMDQVMALFLASGPWYKIG